MPGSFTFKYVAPDGWHYSGVITWPAMFHFSKDVSNSPPGEAALKVTEIPLADGLVQSYTNTDRGRSGPELAVQPGTFGWHIAHLAKADPTGLVKAPDCQSFGTPSYNSRPQEDPQDVDLLCDVLPGPLFTQNDPPWVISGPSVREKTVNAFLKNVAAYPYVWLTKIHDCDIWFYTNGKVVKPNWGDCGKFTITK